MCKLVLHDIIKYHYFCCTKFTKIKSDSLYFWGVLTKHIASTWLSGSCRKDWSSEGEGVYMNNLTYPPSPPSPHWNCIGNLSHYYRLLDEFHSCTIVLFIKSVRPVFQWFGMSAYHIESPFATQHTGQKWV